MAITVLSVKSMRTVVLTCLLLLTALQGAGAQEAVVDPPSRVARLSYIDGVVSLAPAGTEEWAEAVLNRPLTSGDRVWVDNGARAELQVGSASIHLDQGSGFSFVDLDDDLLHMNLTEGTATIRVQRKRDNERLEIDTPNTTVSLLHPGEYHIEVTAAGETVVKTRSGESQVRGDRNSYTVRANEEGIFRSPAGEDPSGEGSELTADIRPLGPRTAFEDWANDRDRRNASSVSARYVSREVIGYEDLDRHGEWFSEAGYGYVWRPSYVVAGWAPYRYGRWVWVSPWGWNWIDDARWGFAPFHYGRWAYLRSRWCWVPGPRHIRPVYAPALVAWTGSPGFNVSVSFGSSVGWFPLGPREVYVPGYRHSRRYIHDVNVSNTIIVNNTHITNIYNGRAGRFDYRYGHNPGAVTVVHRDRFVGGRPIGGHYSRTDERDLRRWHHDARPPAIVPDRDSVLAARTVAARARINDAGRIDAIRDNRFASRAAGSRVSFDAERQAIEANGGRPVSRSQLIRANPPDHQARQLTRHDQARNQSRNDVRAGREPSRDAPADRAQVTPTRPDRPVDAIRGDEAARSRALNDRPAWARQQRDRTRHALQQSDQLRDRRDEDRNRRSSAQPAVPPNALRSDHSNASPGSPPSIVDGSGRQWRGDNTPYRVQRDAPRVQRESGQNSLQDSRPFRDSRERAADRSSQQLSRPQYSAPREQPRHEPRAEQPRMQQPQPRIERASPERSRPERASRQQNGESRSGQSHPSGRQTPRTQRE